MWELQFCLKSMVDNMVDCRIIPRFLSAPRFNNMGANGAIFCFFSAKPPVDIVIFMVKNVKYMISP
jgi:hypothetical protein